MRKLLNFLEKYKILDPWLLGYLAQIHFDNEDRLVIDELRRAFVEILELEKQLDIAEEKMKKNLLI